MVDPLNPYTEEQKQQINDAITQADNLILAIGKAAGAGIEADERLKTTKENRAKLVRIRDTYFPNG